MKWIGQNIYDLASRFRNDVFLEDVATGTIASGGNLGLDSNNKIVKATETTGDITRVSFTTDSGAVSRGQVLSGDANFSILGTSGVGVTNSTTTITVTSVPGEIDHDSLLNFAANEHYTQANITTVGTIGTGVWNGDAIASAYLDADTAHLTTAQTFTGSKTMGTTTKFNFRDANSYIYSPSANDLEIVATDIVLDAADGIKLEADTFITGSLSCSECISAAFVSSQSSKPVVTIKNTTNDSSSPSIIFQKDRGAAAVNSDGIGSIYFIGENDAEQYTPYGNISVLALEVDDGDEAGKMVLSVAESNGTTSQLTAGLLIEGSDNTTDGEVNVTIAAGAASVTTIAGNLVVTGTGINIPSVYGSTIKLIPSDFLANDDGGNTKFGIGYVETAGTGYGMRVANNATELYAFVSIPQGMKATAVVVYDKNNLAVAVFEAQINATTMAALETGNCNTGFTITDTNSTATNFLVIQVTTTSATNDKIYGGAVTIAVQ